MNSFLTRLSLRNKNLIQTRMATTLINSEWRYPVPCKVGDRIGDIDTPCLIVDLDKMEYNLKLLPKLMQQWPNVALRPHMKAHKTPALAALQMKHGAVGVCCQTLTETEAMVYGGGITDILLSNQLIGKKKLRRLAALAKHGKITVCVDNIHNIHDIDEVCAELECKLGLVIEVNVGQNRCGVEPGEAAVGLAKEIQKLDHVYFKGIQCYQGFNQHVRKADDRSKEVDSVANLTKKTLKALEDNGIDCNYVTGGGTGSFPYESASNVFTEVQPGSYVFMDVDYSKNYGEDGKFIHEFEHSLFVLSTVQSVTEGKRAVVDAGIKATTMECGEPTVYGRNDLTYIIGGDEHGILTPQGNLQVGDVLKLIPGHCDPTSNLHDWLIGIRNDMVETVWPVLARNPGV